MLPFSLIKFLIEKLFNFLPVSLSYILSPSRKDLETAPKRSILENIQDLGIIMFQRNKQGLKAKWGHDLKAHNNSLAILYREQEASSQQSHCNQGREGGPSSGYAVEGSEPLIQPCIYRNFTKLIILATSVLSSSLMSSGHCWLLQFSCFQWRWVRPGV